VKKQQEEEEEKPEKTTLEDGSNCCSVAMAMEERTEMRRDSKLGQRRRLSCVLYLCVVCCMFFLGERVLIKFFSFTILLIILDNYFLKTWPLLTHTIRKPSDETVYTTYLDGNCNESYPNERMK
jgi:hypothetical protein